MSNPVGDTGSTSNVTSIDVDINSMPVDTEMFMAVLMMQLESLDAYTRDLLQKVQTSVRDRQENANMQAQLRFLQQHATAGGADRNGDTVVYLDDQDPPNLTADNSVSAQEASDAGFVFGEEDVVDGRVAYRTLVDSIPRNVLPFDGGAGVNKYGDRPALSRGNFGEALDALDARMEKLNASAQLDMLSLNQMMSKRQQAFEMTSNMIKKLDDTKSSIIANIR